LVDQIEPKAEPRFRAVAEASRAEFGRVLVDVRDIHAKMPRDRVSCKPPRPLGLVSVDLLAGYVGVVSADTRYCVGLIVVTRMRVCQASPFVSIVLWVGDQWPLRGGRLLRQWACEP
jgi:hypothetical protein